jgi:hypothetical protein
MSMRPAVMGVQSSWLSAESEPAGSRDAFCCIVVPRGSGIRRIPACQEDPREPNSQGQYTVTVFTALPLEEAGMAQEIGRSGQSIGKIVLVVDPAKSKSR